MNQTDSIFAKYDILRNIATYLSSRVTEGGLWKLEEEGEVEVDQELISLQKRQL